MNLKTKMRRQPRQHGSQRREQQRRHQQAVPLLAAPGALPPALPPALALGEATPKSPLLGDQPKRPLRQLGADRFLAWGGLALPTPLRQRGLGSWRYLRQQAQGDAAARVPAAAAAVGAGTAAATAGTGLSTAAVQAATRRWVLASQRAEVWENNRIGMLRGVAHHSGLPALWLAPHGFAVEWTAWDLLGELQVPPGTPMPAYDLMDPRTLCRSQVEALCAPQCTSPESSKGVHARKAQEAAGGPEHETRALPPPVGSFPTAAPPPPGQLELGALAGGPVGFPPAAPPPPPRPRASKARLFAVMEEEGEEALEEKGEERAETIVRTQVAPPPPGQQPQQLGALAGGPVGFARAAPPPPGQLQLRVRAVPGVARAAPPSPGPLQDPAVLLREPPLVGAPMGAPPPPEDPAGGTGATSSTTAVSSSGVRPPARRKPKALFLTTEGLHRPQVVGGGGEARVRATRGDGAWILVCEHGPLRAPHFIMRGAELGRLEPTLGG